MKPAIIEPAITQFVAEGRALQKAIKEAEDTAQIRRLEMGGLLLKARSALPKRGSREDGWGHFLEAIEMDEATAWRYMKLAEAVIDPNFHVKDRLPTYADLGLDKRVGPEPPEAPAPRDEDEPPEANESAERTVTPDRNTWCTPKWLADAIGPWDLDPCSNERSHIQAAREFRWERSEDGIFMASSVDAGTRVFINPPYARNEVIRWVQAYAHTKFCFLLKFDPSTEWFETLLENTKLILMPRRTRIEFEPPPGIEDTGGVQFPHALFYARAADAAASIRDLCYPAWSIQ